jgi:DNA-binding PadR family transcriptional regulator
LEQPNEIRYIFLDFLLLKQIQETSEGISGYELQKKINSIISDKFELSNLLSYNKISQTRIYRVLDDFKSKGYVIVKENVIVNKRLQNLFQISENGIKYFNEISKMIKEFFPSENSIESIIEDLLTGKISPLEIFYNKIPPHELLNQLKEFRKFLLKEIKRVDTKITELESESQKLLTKK